MYKFLDLFSGIGGFHKALKDLDWECVGSSEIDLNAQKIYEKEYGIKSLGDIKNVSVKNFVNLKNVNMICGGFPCQPYSISGKQKGLKDPRGKLFFEMIRLIEEIKPEVIFLENVKNLLGHNEGKTFKKMKKSLEYLGYHVKYEVLNAASFGFPTSRSRLYIVGFKDENFAKNFRFPEESNLRSCVKSVLKREKGKEILRADIKWDKNWEEKEKIAKKLAGTCNQSNVPIRLGIVGKGGQGERIYSVYGPSITLSAQGGGVGAKTGLYWINGGVRRLTLKESLRLMGFNEKMDFQEIKDPYKPVGNAVVVGMIKLIGKEIDNVLKDKK